MRPAIPVRLQLSGLAFGASVVAVVTVYAVSAREETARLDAEAQTEIAELRHLDSQLNEEILKARFGLAAHYDDVSSVQRRLERRAADHRRLPLQGGAQQPVDAARERLLVELTAKGNRIEQVKFDRAAAKNSAQYFPVVVDEALRAEPPLPPDEVARVRRVAHAALALALAPGAAAADALEATIGELPRSTRREVLDNVRIHAERIHLGHTFDARLRRALAIPTQARIDELERVYAARTAASDEDNLRFLLALAALSSALFIAVAWVIRRLSVMTTSARRFVPYEFLEMLGKTSLADIKRGDAVRVEMSVLFADIRDFTTRSERRSPEENFRFMNEYLGAMEGPIHAQGGFVNQYLGDGIMALFPRSAADALKAARGMFDALETLNARLGEEAVRIGIGLNTGSLMLGTLGGRDRMNAGVISDAVNLAARVEGLTKRYGVRLLLSEHTRSRIDGGQGLSLRTVDRVLVKGTQRPILIYQLIDVEPDHRAEALLSALPTHERAIELYFQRRFTEARALFQQVLGSVPGDRVAEQLMVRCREFEAEPPPTTWDGSIRMDDK